jgi:hypothetical protein
LSIKTDTLKVMNNEAPQQPSENPTVPQQPLNPQLPHTQKSKKLIIAAGILLLLIAIPVTLTLVQSQQDNRQEASGNKKQPTPMVSTAQQAGDTAVTSEGDATDDVLMLLNEEYTEDAASDAQEDTDATDVTSTIQDIEVIGSSNPEDTE